MEQVHSVPLRNPAVRCAVPEMRAACPGLRSAVLGYSTFRSGTGRVVRHRLLPIASVSLIVDFAAPGGVVTGARDRMTGHGLTGWGDGVSIGLSPAGVPALLGMPAGELAGRTVRLSDVLGRRAGHLTARLAGAAGAAEQFALLDRLLTAWASDRYAPDPAVAEAWRRLPGGRAGKVAADLGVSRRYLERSFRRQVGVSPGAVARIARFQRVVDHLSRGVPPATTAAECGYTDQSHLTRDIRVLAGMTPSALAECVRFRTAAE